MWEQIVKQWLPSWDPAWPNKQKLDWFNAYLRLWDQYVRDKQGRKI